MRLQKLAYFCLIAPCMIGAVCRADLPGEKSIDTGMKQPLEVATDRAALVMLKETDDTLAVTVTDPLHSTEEPIIKVRGQPQALRGFLLL